MKTKINYLTENDCFKLARPLQPTGILIHSTGVNQKRISAYTGQWNKSGVEVLVHGFIGLDDSGQLCYEQNLPYTSCCWGCGSGSKGSFNRSHIQIELCEDFWDGDWCRRLYDAAMELSLELCREFSIAPENVVTHCEAHAMGYASNHADIMHWWSRYDLGMDAFRTELAEKLRSDNEDYRRFKALMARYEEEQRAKAVSPYAEEAAHRAVKSGLFADGDGDGSMDMPQAPLKRQELAEIYLRRGII